MLLVNYRMMQLEIGYPLMATFRGCKGVPIPDITWKPESVQPKWLLTGLFLLFLGLAAVLFEYTMWDKTLPAEDVILLVM